MTKKQIRKEFNPEYPSNHETFFTEYEKYLEQRILEMEKENFRRFVRLQKKFIDDYKYFRSQEANKDLGQEACFDWIDKYSNSFSKLYWKGIINDNK